MVSTQTVVTMVFREEDYAVMLNWTSIHDLTISGAEEAAKTWAANHLLPTPTSIEISTVLIKENT